MSNLQTFNSSGPPSTQQELRIAFVEAGTAGIARITAEEVAIGANAPPTQAGIVAAAERVTARDRFFVRGTADVVLTANDCGKVLLAVKTSGNQTFTLPAAQVSGLEFTFILGNTGTQLLINPVGTDVISLKASEGGANVTTVSPLGVKNTTATHVLNDHVTLVSDGVGTWWATSESGTWASQ